ncbi:MAG: hypothetical protein QF733_06135 [Phycisphaerales bacterium]|jgi:hypothetical protein|nr:hypothetical protein [Phycisphaerales bacterium]
MWALSEETHLMLSGACAKSIEWEPYCLGDAWNIPFGHETPMDCLMQGATP